MPVFVIYVGNSSLKVKNLLKLFSHCSTKDELANKIRELTLSLDIKLIIVTVLPKEVAAKRIPLSCFNKD